MPRVSPELQSLTTFIEARNGAPSMLVGWTTKVNVRADGRRDCCFIAPDNKRYRSMQEVARHLMLTPSTRA